MSESKKLDSDVWTKAINALYKYESIQQSNKGQATSKLSLLSSYSKPIFAQVTNKVMDGWIYGSSFRGR